MHIILIFNVRCKSDIVLFCHLYGGQNDVFNDIATTEVPRLFKSGEFSIVKDLRLKL